MYIFSAIVLGLMGSFHCIGMCGPIALALPLNKSSWWSKVIGLLQYNFGRAITYAILGAIFGVLGESFSLGGYQRKISIIMGSLMIISVLFPALFRWHRKLDVIIINIQSELKKRFGLIFAKQSNKHLIIIGLLNGLLPCGLVYIALAGAIATGGVGSGALFMFVFGIGTIPMLLALSIMGNMITLKLKSRINKLIPVIIVIIGLLFILRGMGLGIPMLSPPDNRLQLNKGSMKMKNSQVIQKENDISTLAIWNSNTST